MNALHSEREALPHPRVTQADLIRRLLLQGPLTAYEAGTATELGMRMASAYLTTMIKTGEAKIAGKVSARTRLSHIYEMTQRGSVMAKRRGLT